jgi:hypothetical protein
LSLNLFCFNKNPEASSLNSSKNFSRKFAEVGPMMEDVDTVAEMLFERAKNLRLVFFNVIYLPTPFNISNMVF